MKNILEGVNHFHSMNVMHRDLKPENIVLTNSQDDNYDLKIIDFGLAGDENNKNEIFRRCGTPGFVAPEIYTAKKVGDYGKECDIFSIGVIFYGLYTYISFHNY